MNEKTVPVTYNSIFQLAFADKAIEKDFKTKQIPLITLLFRFALLISIALYSCFYFIVLPTQSVNYQSSFLAIYQVVTLYCVLLFSFSYSKNFQAHQQIYTILSAVIISVGVLLTAYNIPPLASLILQSTGLPITAFFILFGLSWVQAFTLAILYFAASLGVISLLNQAFIDFTFAIFNLFGFFIIASIAGFILEKQKRQTYLAEQHTDRLINDLEQSKIQLHELSIKDSLTELFNRRHFDDVGELKIKEAKRLKSTMHLLMIDIDYFKQYNDHYGHPAGDDVLVIVANTLLKTLRRSTDLVFRVGGEEFAAILLGDASENLKQISQSIHNAINTLAIEHNNSTIEKYITVSIGLASMNTSTNETFGDLYNKADKALYLAKQSGRNKTSIF